MRTAVHGTRAKVEAPMRHGWGALRTCQQTNFIDIIAVPEVIEKILKQPCLDPRLPRIAPARREEIGDLFKAV
jgi:hypothetical protein